MRDDAGPRARHGARFLGYTKLYGLPDGSKAGATSGEAAAIAEQVRLAVECEPVAGLMITMSFGVSASLPGSFDDDRVFAEADIALYEAKHAGRNRIGVRHLVAEASGVERDRLRRVA